MREGVGFWFFLASQKEHPSAWLPIPRGYTWRLGRPCMSDELGERGTAERSEESNELRSNTIMCVNQAKPLVVSVRICRPCAANGFSCLCTDNSHIEIIIILFAYIRNNIFLCPCNLKHMPYEYRKQQKK